MTLCTTKENIKNVGKEPRKDSKSCELQHDQPETRKLNRGIMKNVHPRSNKNTSCLKEAPHKKVPKSTFESIKQDTGIDKSVEQEVFNSIENGGEKHISVSSDRSNLNFDSNTSPSDEYFNHKCIKLSETNISNAINKEKTVWEDNKGCEQINKKCKIQKQKKEIDNQPKCKKTGVLNEAVQQRKSMHASQNTLSKCLSKSDDDHNVTEPEFFNKAENETGTNLASCSKDLNYVSDMRDSSKNEEEVLKRFENNDLGYLSPCSNESNSDSEYAPTSEESDSEENDSINKVQKQKKEICIRPNSKNKGFLKEVLQQRKSMHVFQNIVSKNLPKSDDDHNVIEQNFINKAENETRKNLPSCSRDSNDFSDMYNSSTNEEVLKNPENNDQVHLSLSSNESNSDSEYVPSLKDSDAEENDNIIFCKSNKAICQEKSPIASSATTVWVLGTNNKTTRKWDKKYCCPFCKGYYAKLPRHLESAHANEDEIAEMKNLSGLSEKKRRNEIFCKLRNIGNHLHNIEVLNKGTGFLMVVYRPNQTKEVERDYYIPCTMCYGYFSKRELWKHKCSINNKNKHATVAGGRNLLPLPPYVDENVKEILNTMRQDSINRIIKSDRIIVEFMRRAYHAKGGHQMHKKAEIRNNARELGRFLSEVRIVKKEDSCTILDIIDPKEYENVLSAIRRLTQYDSVLQRFSTPELARKIGLHLKTCGVIAQGFAIERNDNIMREKSESFLKLHELKFFVEIGAEAKRFLNTEKRRKPKLLPLSQDIVKLTAYLREKSMKDMENLKNNELPREERIKAWIGLQKTTLCQLIIFNRRREGEVSRMELKDYNSKKDADENSEIESSLNTIEQNLCKILTRVEIQGKNSNNVPVLLTPHVKESIDTLLKYRKYVGVSEGNNYLFASCLRQARSHYRGSHCLKIFSEECGAANPELLRSTKLRKHVATLSQILNLQENELESLARFMGHDIKIHRDYYRMPDAIHQKAKLSKIFLSLEKGKLVSENFGKSLDELEVSLESKWNEYT